MGKVPTTRLCHAFGNCWRKRATFSSVPPINTRRTRFSLKKRAKETLRRAREERQTAAGPVKLVLQIPLEHLMVLGAASVELFEHLAQPEFVRVGGSLGGIYMQVNAQ